MGWWQRLRGFRAAVTSGATATVLASSLVKQDVEDAEAVAQLRALGAGQQTLRDAAGLMARSAKHGYPYSRIHRLLRAAADEPLPAPTEQQATVEARQRQLWMQPFAASFRELAQQVPALEELERRAQDDRDSFMRDLSLRESGLIGAIPPRKQRDREIRVLVGIHKEVKRLVGPQSGVTDPVLSSIAAARAACMHLRETAGIDPRTWSSHGG
jgi:hypothetical protein